MEFDNAFEVPLPPEQAWPLLLDIERIAPCMPGAELTEVVDDRTYKGRTHVRLGPVALSFGGVVTFEEIDAAARACKVTAQGTDSKGRGGANATVAFRIEPSAGGSTVKVHTSLALTGTVAQYGRSTAIVQATAAQLIKQFAEALRAELAANPPAAAA
ncbi:SRPBCC family protein, partial [Rhodoplanes sp. TEM]